MSLIFPLCKRNFSTLKSLIRSRSNFIRLNGRDFHVLKALLTQNFQETRAVVKSDYLEIPWAKLAEILPEFSLENLEQLFYSTLRP